MKIKKATRVTQIGYFKVPQNALIEAMGEERATQIKKAQKQRSAHNQPTLSYQAIANDLLDMFATKDSSGLNMAMEVALTVARKKPEAALAFLRDMIKEEKASKSQQGQTFAPVIIQTPNDPSDIVKNVINAVTSNSPTIELPQLPDSLPGKNPMPFSPSVEELSERTEKLPFETEEPLNA